MTTKLLIRAGLCLCAGGTLAASAAAQESERTLNNILRTVEGGQQFTPHIDTTLSLWERAQIDYGGSVGWSYLSLNQAGGNSVALKQPDVTAYARATLDGAQTFFVRADFTYQNFSPGDSFDGRGSEWVVPSLDRYWYEFDLRKAMDAYQKESIDWNFNIRAGRIFADWGASLAFSEALYGGVMELEIDPRNRIRGIVGLTPDHTADFDSSRQNYDTVTRRFYYGAMLSHTFERGDEVYAYWLGMGDHSAFGNSTVGGLTGISFEREGAYVGVGGSGSLSQQWLYLWEAVYLYGSSASDPLQGPQQSDDLSAWAGRAQATYVFGDDADSRLQFELLIASGDSDRLSSTNTVGGNTPGTADHGFVALGYAFNGVAFAPAFSNLVTFRAGAASFPFRTSSTFRELQVGTDLILSFKYDSYGGIDEPTNNSTFLGFEADLYANWRITSDLAITARYGAFFPGSAIPQPDNIRNFIYAGVTLTF